MDKLKKKYHIKNEYLITTESGSYLSKKIIIDSIIISIIETIITDIKQKLLIKPTIRLFGKECHQQRDVGFFSNTSIGYKYSGKLMESQVLTPNMTLLINYVNKIYGTKYNSILINRYNNGKQYIGAHSDDEAGLDSDGVVAISYGATRVFRIRSKATKKIMYNIPLNHLSMIRMGGDFQKEFTHEIPIESKVKSERISLTFRNHLI